MKKVLSKKNQKFPPQDNVLPSERSRLNKKPVRESQGSEEQDEDEEKLSVGNSQDARWQSAQEDVTDQEAFNRVYDDQVAGADLADNPSDQRKPSVPILMPEDLKRKKADANPGAGEKKTIKQK